MTLTTLIIANLITGLSTSQSPANSSEELPVYTAVLSQTIRPRLRIPPERAVILIDRTLAVCRPTDAPMSCVSDEHIRFFEARVAAAGPVMFDRVLTAIARKELGTSFRERNRNNRSFAGAQLDQVTLVSSEQLSQVLKSGSDPKWSFLRLSQAGYSGDGHALIYASYWCGNACGYGWFILLERRADSWQVISTNMLWIS